MAKSKRVQNQKNSSQSKPTTTSNPSSTRTRRRPDQDEPIENQPIDMDQEDGHVDAFKMPQNFEEPRKRRMASLNAEALMHIYASPADLNSFMTSEAGAAITSAGKRRLDSHRLTEKSQQKINNTRKRSKLNESDADKTAVKVEADELPEVHNLMKTNPVKQLSSAKKGANRKPVETNGNKKIEVKLETIEIVDKPRPKREASRSIVF